jgi:DNA-binding winged helix-turn-helix (wHTH) protein/TolB-like protein/Tfp pilus assembly protein PilF
LFFEEPLRTLASKQLQPVYKFGPFHLNPAERLLLRDGELVPLAPKVFDTLIVLTEHSGHLVEKDELMSRLWPDTFVEEATLARNISDLRKALGETSGGYKYIETVPKRGYRFITDVCRAGDAPELMTERSARLHLVANQAPQVVEQVQQTAVVGAPSLDAGALDVGGKKQQSFLLKRTAAWVAALGMIVALAGTLLYLLVSSKQQVAPPGVITIAVLPFKPINLADRDEYLEFGMAETLIMKLSQINRVVVRPMDSARKYAGLEQDPLAVGQKLKVDFVLEGGLQKKDDRIRVTARLVRVSDGHALWADTFDQNSTDVFYVQEAISEQMASALDLRLTSDEQRRVSKRHTENIEAYNLYLKGRYHEGQFTEERVKTGIGYFRKAIEKDPDYALAYSGLADSYVALGTYYFLSPQEAFAEASQAATRAAQIDEMLAEAYVSLAIVRLCNWDWPGYEKNARRARELNPHYAKIYYIHSQYLAALGRFEEARAEAKRAQEFESPLDLSTNLGWILYFGRRYDEAIEQYLKAVDLDHDHFRPHRLLGLAYLQKVQPEKAIAAIQQSVALSGGSLEEKAYLGYAQAMAGQRGEALKILRELREQAEHRYVSPYLLALVAVGLGDKDQVFVWLNQAYADGSINLIYLNVEPIFDSLRSTPRWETLIRRMNLPKEQHGRLSRGERE